MNPRRDDTRATPEVFDAWAESWVGVGKVFDRESRVDVTKRRVGVWEWRVGNRGLPGGGGFCVTQPILAGNANGLVAAVLKEFDVAFGKGVGWHMRKHRLVDWIVNVALL